MGVSNAQNPGVIGGSSTISLSTSHLPSHAHYFSTESSGSHNHDYTDMWSKPVGEYHMMGGLVPAFVLYNLNAMNSSSSTVTSGAHTHTGTTNPTGSGTAFDNKPPYYKIAYIMKL